MTGASYRWPVMMVRAFLSLAGHDRAVRVRAFCSFTMMLVGDPLHHGVVPTTFLHRFTAFLLSITRFFLAV
jgi:hypothetical protein